MESVLTPFLGHFQHHNLLTKGSGEIMVDIFIYRRVSEPFPLRW